MIHRTDNDNWALPGGAMDLDESLIDTAVRETKRPALTVVSRVWSVSTPIPSTSFSTRATVRCARNSRSCSSRGRPAGSRGRALPRLSLTCRANGFPLRWTRWRVRDRVRAAAS
ncbi:MAG: NUDIX domain-containing protein [Pseudonocardiaceae bacterium]